MSRYGFAIKALPKTGVPFGDDDEDQESGDTESTETDGAPDAADATTGSAPAPGEQVRDPAPAGDEEVPEDEVPDGPSSTGSDVAGEEAASAPTAGPEDDARPWSGDMYDAGDETSPADAFAAYQGADGEEAWLDQAPDGTLTGWVRDATGQVWRYMDPDVWAIDVDDAQMTRSHSQASGNVDEGAETEHGGQDSLFRPKQS